MSGRRTRYEQAMMTSRHSSRAAQSTERYNPRGKRGRKRSFGTTRQALSFAPIREVSGAWHRAHNFGAAPYLAGDEPQPRRIQGTPMTNPEARYETPATIIQAGGGQSPAFSPHQLPTVRIEDRGRAYSPAAFQGRAPPVRPAQDPTMTEVDRSKMGPSAFGQQAAEVLEYDDPTHTGFHTPQTYPPTRVGSPRTVPQDDPSRSASPHELPTVRQPRGQSPDFSPQEIRPSDLQKASPATAQREEREMSAQLEP